MAGADHLAHSRLLGHRRDYGGDGQVEDLRLALAGAVHGRGCRWPAAGQNRASLVPADPCRETVTPSRLDQHPPGRAVPRFGDAALSPSLSAAIL